MLCSRQETQEGDTTTTVAAGSTNVTQEGVTTTATTTTKGIREGGNNATASPVTWSSIMLEKWDLKEILIPDVEKI